MLCWVFVLCWFTSRPIFLCTQCGLFLCNVHSLLPLRVCPMFIYNNTPHCGIGFCLDVYILQINIYIYIYIYIEPITKQQHKLYKSVPDSPNHVNYINHSLITRCWYCLWSMEQNTKQNKIQVKYTLYCYNIWYIIELSYFRIKEEHINWYQSSLCTCFFSTL